jgi:uncharacterized damage-inducible protein DinB
MTDDPRIEPPGTGNEWTILTTMLNWHRATLYRKCAGLSDEQLRQHAVPSSDITLLGLLRHLAGVERWWFQVVIAGEDAPAPYDTDGFSKLDESTGEQARAVLDQHISRSREIAAARSLDDMGKHPRSGEEFTLRWVLVHMIEEYSRHNGHADLIREAIDGEAGE